MPRILCVESDPAASRRIVEMLRALGHETTVVARVSDARAALARRRFDLVLAADALPDGAGIELLDEAGEAPDATPLVVTCAFGDEAAADTARRRGAFLVVTRPLREESLRLAVVSGIELGGVRRENRELRRRSAQPPVPTLIGNCSEFRDAVQGVDANPNGTMLFVGEAGTGKTLLAEVAWSRGPRRERPMVRVPLAAMTPAFQEETLFGPDGAFERASGGTLLMDEIAALGPRLQDRLWRAFQDGEFDRGPGSRPVPLDARLLFTTRANLMECVSRGQFRKDLFYRISVTTVPLPPLRSKKRLEDLGDLAAHFAQRTADALGVRTPAIPEETIRHLEAYAWPGNVRELENAVARAVIVSRDQPLRPEAFAFLGSGRIPTVHLETLRRYALEIALAQAKGSAPLAARQMGVAERTVRNMKKKLVGERDDGRRPRPDDGPRPGRSPKA